MPDDLLFYLLDLRALRERFLWGCVYSVYCHLLLGAILAEVPPLIALEATPFGALLVLLLFPGIDVHWLSGARVRGPLPLRVATLVASVRGLGVGRGGGDLLLAPRLLFVASVWSADAVRLVVRLVALAFFVH